MPSAMTHIPKRKGWKPDHVDSRDKPFRLIREHMFAATVAPQDEDYEIDDSHVEVFDQLSEASCVANAWTAVIEVLEFLEFKVTVTPRSRQFLYWTARCLTGSQKFDNGTYLRSGAKALASTGICSEIDWAYNPSKVLVSPPAKAFLQASNNRLKAYYAIQSTGDDRLADMELAVHANHPVTFGTQVGMDLEQYEGSAADKNKIFDYPITSAGGHALAVMGVRRVMGRRSWKIRNSWGRGWGLNGYFWASDSYMRSSGTSDLWVVTYSNKFAI